MSNEMSDSFQDKLSFIAGELFALKVLTATALANVAGDKQDPLGFLNRVFDRLAEDINNMHSIESPELMDITKTAASLSCENMRNSLTEHWGEIWKQYDRG